MHFVGHSVPQQRLAQLRRLRRRALKCQPLRYSQPPRRKRAKALFRRLPGVCSVPRATTQRRRICASRCYRDVVRIRDQKLFVSIRDDLLSARVGRRRAAFESSPEERSACGSLRACCLSAASLQARRWREYRSGWHEVPDDLGSASASNPCACAAPKIFCMKSAPSW